MTTPPPPFVSRTLFSQGSGDTKTGGFMQRDNYEQILRRKAGTISQIFADGGFILQEDVEIVASPRLYGFRQVSA
jgi:hypothetical protein